MAVPFPLLVASLLLLCATSACGDEGASGANGDGDGASQERCADLNQAECEERGIELVDEDHACHPINGRKWCEGAEGESITLKFVLCAEGGDGDATLVTCASDPETGEAYSFPSTDIPPTWSEVGCDEEEQICGMGGAG